MSRDPKTASRSARLAVAFAAAVAIVLCASACETTRTTKSGKKVDIRASKSPPKSVTFRQGEKITGEPKEPEED
jgi:hypothetical protein